MDVQNTYGLHVQEQCAKAEGRMAALIRIMPNIGGPGTRMRMILYNVVQSILLYAAPVWKYVIKIKRHKERLEKTQRMALLRVAAAYRTVSTKALQVILGIPPIDLLVEERDRLHRSGEGHIRARRIAEREMTVREWQDSWHSEREVGQWTKRLIPSVKDWYKCEWGALGYFVTQFLTRHGSYGVYRKRIGKRPNGECRYCREIEDTPEHTFMVCPRWEHERIEVGNRIGDMRQVEDITARNRNNWNNIWLIIKKIMSIKEREEREQQ